MIGEFCVLVKTRDFLQLPEKHSIPCSVNCRKLVYLEQPDYTETKILTEIILVVEH